MRADARPPDPHTPIPPHAVRHLVCLVFASSFPRLPAFCPRSLNPKHPYTPTPETALLRLRIAGRFCALLDYPKLSLRATGAILYGVEQRLSGKKGESILRSGPESTA